MTDKPVQAMTEEQANEIIWKAVEHAGGTRSIYRNPRMAYAPSARRKMDIDGYVVDLRHGEISTPAVATVEGWVFEIHEEDIELLLKPRKKG